jgi:hypothetical protein
MSLLEILRGYTLREYAVVLAMSLLGALGLVFMLNSMGGGASAGETLLKRDTPVHRQTASLRFVESNAAAEAHARTLAARRAKFRAERRVIAVRAARRAAAAAARRAPAPKRTVVRTTPQALVPASTPVVNTTPSRPTPRPQPASAPKPTPQKSGVTGGGGGGSFDDSG